MNIEFQAGLGRTGTLIAAYLIKHYKMNAKEAIAWTRICRTGSVIGHQQSWLEDIENELWSSGEQYKLRNFGNSKVLLHHHHGIYSIASKIEKKIQPMSAGSCTSPGRTEQRSSKFWKNDYFYSKCLFSKTWKSFSLRNQEWWYKLGGGVSNMILNFENLVTS